MSPIVHDEALSEAAREINDALPEDQFVVDVSGYEGPLHLLLDLARRQKVDLLQVSILELSEQYLAFIMEARRHRIDLAADYLLMASWLAYLKSRLLLPEAPKAEGENAPESADLARRLSFRLARLEAMRQAIAALKLRDVTGRDVFVRGLPEQARVTRNRRCSTSLHDLMKAFGDIHARKSNKRSHVVYRQPVLALESARKTLKTLAPRLDDWQSISGLERPDGEPDDTPRKSILASYFAAALELTRDRAIDVRQDRPLSDVMVKRHDGGEDTPLAAE